MPSENNSQPTYELFEDRRAIKFMDKNSEDEKLIKRIHGKYYQLAIDPYKEAERSFKSRKCPKCKKTRVGIIGLYISSMNQLKKLKLLILALEGPFIKNGINFF